MEWLAKWTVYHRCFFSLSKMLLVHAHKKKPKCRSWRDGHFLKGIYVLLNGGIFLKGIYVLRNGGIFSYAYKCDPVWNFIFLL